jgi:hypothetical protein
MPLPRAAPFHSLFSFTSSRISSPSALGSSSMSRNTSRTHTSSVDTRFSDHGPERALPYSSSTSHSTCSVSQLRLVVARPQSIHIRRGGSSSRYTRDVKHDPSLYGIPLCFPCRPARAPSQSHPRYLLCSGMDGLRIAVALCHVGSLVGVTSAPRAPEYVCGYCTSLL